MVVAHLGERAASLQLRVADKITAFAGSMTFVYIHAVAFAVWMLVFEQSPWPTFDADRLARGHLLVDVS